jgi:hypothetical protein
VLVTNIVYSVANTCRFLLLALMVPILFAAYIASSFERLFRFFLGVPAFLVFLFSAKVKKLLTYHINNLWLIVDSKAKRPQDIAGIRFRKPKIRINLSCPSVCPDSMQADNLIHFENLISDSFPLKNRIRFRTIVYYPKDVSALNTELPLTAGYIRTAYTRVSYITSNQGGRS